MANRAIETQGIAAMLPHCSCSQPRPLRRRRPETLIALILPCLLGAVLFHSAGGQEASSGNERPAAMAPGRPVAGRLHLLVVADTNDSTIGDSVQADLKSVTAVFAASVPRQHLNITTLSGARVGPQAVLRAVRSLSIQQGRDAVVVYFSGHGAFDRNTAEHVLMPGRRQLRRSDVRAAIQRLGPRLAVLVTDTCSEYIKTPPRAMAPAAGPEITPLFSALFFTPRGLVDVSCTKPGELAMGDSAGGYFTCTLCGYLFAHQNEKRTWSDVLAGVNADLPVQYPGAQQTAYAVSPLPSGDGQGGAPGTEGATGHGATSGQGSAAINGPRLGVVTQRTPRSAQLGGVEVTEVYPGFPGANLRTVRDGTPHPLVPGRDVITEVNGQPVATHDDLRRAVARSGSKLTLRVVDLRTGSSEQYTVEIAAAGGGRFGVSAQKTARSAPLGGIEVIEVLPGFPGASLRSRGDGKVRAMVPHRDVITHINGQPVAEYADYVRAVSQSPREMVVRVYDTQTEKHEDFEVTLKP